MSSTGAADSLRSRLRSETSPHHNNAENALSIMDENLDQDRYRQILSSMLEFHESLEKHLNMRAKLGCSPSLFYVNDRKKLAWIQNDLGIESLSSPTTHFTWFDNSDKILGLLYVVEGSTLGGQVIAKHLKNRKNLENQSHSFFTSYGPHTGLMWTHFLKFLQNHPVKNENEVVEAAKRTFDLISTSMPKK